MPTPVTEIEAETGLSKEVVRKWESRYGFPRPLRDANGERLYPDEQIADLKLIRRLIDAGMRPSKVVGLEHDALRGLTEVVSLRPESTEDSFIADALAALKKHDLEQLQQMLRQRLGAKGLLDFVQDDIAHLNVAVGEYWLRGELRVFEEHIYAEIVQDLLRQIDAMMLSDASGPMILLTTPPGELHTFGITMARIVLKLEGARCVSLGGQTPVPEICEAAASLGAAAVAISASIAHPNRKIVAFLKELARDLRPETAIWIGGMGAARLPPVPRVTATLTFDAARRALSEIPRK